MSFSSLRFERLLSFWSLVNWWFALVLGLLPLAAARAQRPVWQEATAVGTGPGGNSASTTGQQIARGSGGALFVAGGLSGSATFGNLPVARARAGAYVGRMTAAGQWQWVQTISSRSPERLQMNAGALALDGANNVYLGVQNPYGANFSFPTQLGPYGLSGAGMLAKLSAAGQWQWAVALPKAVPDVVAADGSGGLYVAGSFYDTLRLGSFTFVAPNRGYGAFVAHLDNARRWVWVKAMMSTVRRIDQMALDSRGNLVVAGSFGGNSLNLSPTAQVNFARSGAHLFVAQMPANGGAWRWAAGAQGVQFREGYFSSLKLDRTGNPVVIGVAYDTLRFGTQMLLPTAMNSLGFIAKLNTAGQWAWATQVGGRIVDGFKALAITHTGDVIISSTCRGDTTRLGTIVLTEPPRRSEGNWGPNDQFPWGYVARLRGATGQWSWATTLPAFAPLVQQLALDSLSTTLYLIGNMAPSRQGSRFGTQTLTSGTFTAFVAAMGVTNRTWRWAQNLETGGAARGRRLMVDANGNVTLLSDLFGNRQFGGALVRGGQLGQVVARRSAAGNWLWAAEIRGVSSDANGGTTVKDMATDGRGNTYVATDLWADSAWFGNLGVSARPRGSAVARLDAAGRWVWVRDLRATSNSLLTIKGVAADARGNVTIVGSFRDTLTLGPIRLLSTRATNPRYRSTDGFVARLNAAGQWQWAITTNQPEEDNRFDAVVADTGGTVLILAAPLGQDSFRVGNLTTRAQPGRYLTGALLRLDSLGRWVTSYPFENADRPVLQQPFTVFRRNGRGDLLLAGQLPGNQLLGTLPQFVVAVYSPRLGAWRWTRNFGNLNGPNVWPYDPAPGSAALDEAGNVYVTGSLINASLQLDSTQAPITAGAGQLAVVIGLDSLGQIQWIQANQGTSLTQTNVEDIAAYQPGQAVITGFHDGPLTFGTFSLPGTDMANGFLATLAQPLGLPDAPADRAPRGLALWPNPTRETVRVRLPAVSQEPREIRIFNALGQEVRRQRLPAGISEATLPVAALPGGVYVVRCGTQSSRLVIE